MPGARPVVMVYVCWINERYLLLRIGKSWSLIDVFEYQKHLMEDKNV